MAERLTITEKTLVVLLAVWSTAVVFQGLFAGLGIGVIKVDYTLSGQFGDSFGSLSSLMATAAALGAWRAVSYQRQELSEARSTAKVLERQAAKRDFEQLFFNLLGAFQLIQNDMTVNYMGRTEKGRASFSYILDMLGDERRSNAGDVEISYVITFETHRDSLAHYFRFLYNIIKSCDNSDVENCYSYIKLLRSLLSESELTLIALNGIYFPEGKSNFTPLINKYCLLNNISDYSKNEFRLNEYYAESAFSKA